MFLQITEEKYVIIIIFFKHIEKYVKRSEYVCLLQVFSFLILYRKEEKFARFFVSFLIMCGKFMFLLIINKFVNVSERFKLLRKDN